MASNRTEGIIYSMTSGYFEAYGCADSVLWWSLAIFPTDLFDLPCDLAIAKAKWILEEKFCNG